MSKAGLMVVRNVEWNYVRPNVMGGGAPMMNTDRRTIALTCKCGHAWTATKDRVPGQAGKFHEFMGGISVVCPKCGQEDQFSDRDVS